MVDECPPEGFGAAEACEVRGVSDGAARVKPGTGGINSDHFDVGGRSHPKFGSKQSCQLTRTETGPRGKGFHAVVRARVGCNRIGDHSERGLRRWIGLDQRRELRLPTRAFGINDQPASHVADELVAVIPFD